MALMDDAFSAAQRYRGAESDPGLSYDNPTAYPEAEFAAPEQRKRTQGDPGGDLMSSFLSADQGGGGGGVISNLRQLAMVAAALKDVPEAIRSNVLRRMLGMRSPEDETLRRSMIMARMQQQLKEPFQQQQEARRMQSMKNTEYYRDMQTKIRAAQLKFQGDRVAQQRLTASSVMLNHMTNTIKALSDPVTQADPKRAALLAKQFHQQSQLYDQISAGLIDEGDDGEGDGEDGSETPAGGEF